VAVGDGDAFRKIEDIERRRWSKLPFSDGSRRPNLIQYPNLLGALAIIAPRRSTLYRSAAVNDAIAVIQRSLCGNSPPTGNEVTV
jgi:hypothetical protein